MNNVLLLKKVVKGSIFCLIFGLVLISCGKDETEANLCEFTICDNGQCVEGDCLCEIGFKGVYCHEKKIPKKIMAKRLFMYGIPKACKNWDDNDGLPYKDGDFYIVIKEGGKTVYQTDYKINEDCYPCIYNKPIELKGNGVYEIYIYDKDSDGPDELAYKSHFIPWKLLEEWKFFPDERLTLSYLYQECRVGPSLNSHNYSGTLQIKLHEIEYQF